MPQNHVLGVSIPAKYESDIKELLRRQLEGLHVYFAKVSNVPFDLKIGLIGVSRHGEHEFRNKNLTMYSWGPRVDFSKEKYKFVP